MVTTVLNSLFPTTVSCSSNRAVWVQHLGRFAKGMPLDKNLMENHFHYDFFQSVEALAFTDNTERILFCHSLGLFLGDERLPLLDKKGIIALKNAVIKLRCLSINQMAISFLEMGIIPECPVYQEICLFIEQSKNRIPKSIGFWNFFLIYLTKDNIPYGFYSLLKQMNYAGFLNKIKLETLNEMYESSILLGISSIKNLLNPMLHSFKKSTLNQKYSMTLSIGNDLSNFRKEFNQLDAYHRNRLFDENDFSFVGQFMNTFWTSDSFWTIREKLNLNLNPEKELNKYSFISLNLFWMMIHDRESLIQSFMKKGQSSDTIPQFPKDFTFAKMIQYLPKGMIKNIRHYLKNDCLLFFHLAQGNNIRSFSKLPFPLSKKVAHYCIEYLDQSNHLNNAIKKAKLKSWGAKDDQMYDCLDSNIIHFNGDYAKLLWQTAFHNQEKIREVIPLHHLVTYFINRYSIGDFPHKNDLEKEISVYLKAELKRQKTNTWDFANFRGYSTKEENLLYKIIQLDNPILLKEEGKAMSHCVGTYAFNCKRGNCSIWSLRSYPSNGKEHRIATIEVSRHNKVVQVQAKANKAPKQIYKDIILEWVIVEDLTYEDDIF